MKKIIRILGIKGRTTIPYIIRRILGFMTGDILSFRIEDGCVVVKKEKLCDNCENPVWDEREFDQFLDTLSPKEMAHAVKRLTERLCGAGSEGG